MVTGVGHLFYGYLMPLHGSGYGLNEGPLAGILVRTLAGLLFVIGLVPAEAPRFSLKTAFGVALAACAGWVALEAALRLGDPLVMVGVLGVEAVATGEGSGPVPGLTGWHWMLSLAPLALSSVAAVGAFRWMRRGLLGGWLLVALALLSASQLHSALWPSTYGSPVLTSADLLRLAFAGVVAVGGVIELRNIAAERAALLAEERERTRMMGDVATMKADFTAMVAHELSSPLLAVRAYGEMLAYGRLESAERMRVARRLREQTDGLEALIEDIRDSSVIERDDFEVLPRPVAIGGLLAGAASYAEMLPGRCLIETDDATGNAEVFADPARISQVLRNLASNAAEYSPEGSKITIRAEEAEDGGQVRISVRDNGSGIHPDDLALIFEKFGRGRDAEGRKVAGVGLGLYLSRRIVLAHGSDLAARSILGEGATFSFELKRTKKGSRGGRR